MYIEKTPMHRTHYLILILILGIGFVGLPSLESQESTPSTDRYSGKTVADPRTGMNLIRDRAANVPKVGQQAPDFTLPKADGSGTMSLSDFRGKKPVVLVFGSFT